jgi:hypothetical protein
MARVVLQPAPMELGLHREGYEDLVGALTAQGYDVTLEVPEERRGFPGADAAYDLVVFIAGHAEGVAIDALLLEIGRCVGSGSHRRHRLSQLRDLRGRIRDFDLSEPPDD